MPEGDSAWRFDSLVGAGGFGEVWRVRHADLGDEFALKFCLDDRGARMLEREAETLKELRRRLPDHPNIVRLVNLNLRSEPYWLAFDYIAGGTLEAWIRGAGGPRPWADVAPMALGILNGMAAANEAIATRSRPTSCCCAT